MVRATQNPNLPAPRLIDQILSSGQINRQEHLYLASILLSNQKATEKERRQINRIFDYIQTGRVKLID